MWRAQRLAQTTAERIGSSKKLMRPRHALPSGEYLRPCVGRRKRSLLTALSFQNRISSAFSTRIQHDEESYNKDNDTLEKVVQQQQQQQQQQHHQLQEVAARPLFDMLNNIKSGVPQTLLAVKTNSDSSSRRRLAHLWRAAASLDKYRDGNFEKNGKHATTKLSISSSDENLQREEEDFQQDIALYTDTFSSLDVLEEEKTDSSFLDEPSAAEEGAATTHFESDEPIVTDVEYDEEALLQEIEKQLSKAIRERQVDDAIEMFDVAAVQHGVDISMDIVHDLFRLLSFNRPFHCYQMLQYILQRTNTDIFATKSNAADDDDEVSKAESERIGSLYKRMCFSLRLLDPSKSRHGDIRSLVDSVVSDLRQVDEIVERMCLPVLVLSLAEQRAAGIGGWALHYYNLMAEKGYELPPDYFMQLLTCSKYSRQNDLPYHDVLRQVVAAGRNPLPQIVMKALENMFPYTENAEGTYIALQSVMELQHRSLQTAEELQNRITEDEALLAQERDPEKIATLKRNLKRYRRPQSYIIDIAQLESIAAAAARTGCVELTLLLWDALDIFGYEATESIFESTIVCFAKDDNLCENAFVVLSDMEEKGFVPSRALIKSFSLALRVNNTRLEMANNLLQNSLVGSPDAMHFTPTALNVLMAAYAERGRVDETLNLLDEFSKSGMTPNVDSFSSALEAVGKATARMVKNDKLRMAPGMKERVLESYVSVVDTILRQMEEPHGPDGTMIAPSIHLIRNYVEFLCLVHQVDTATDIVVDILEKQSGLEDQSQAIVDNKTILRVAVANAEMGKFVMARRLTASTSEPLPFMAKKIDRIEELANNQ